MASNTIRTLRLPHCIHSSIHMWDKTLPMLSHLSLVHCPCLMGSPLPVAGSTADGFLLRHLPKLDVVEYDTLFLLGFGGTAVSRNPLRVRYAEVPVGSELQGRRAVCLSLYDGPMC